MVCIGQKIQFRPAFWTKAEIRPIVTGIIVWIHPQNRYVRVSGKNAVWGAIGSDAR